MVLSAPADREDAELASRLSDLTARLVDLESAAPTPPAEAPPVEASPVTAAAPAVPDPASTATPPAAPAPTPAPQAVPEPPVAAAAPPATGADTGETPDLVGSLMRHDRYVAALGLENPSLEEFLAGPPADPGAAATADAPPAPSDVDAAAVVDIGTLCYSGPQAFERALSLREGVRAALADPSRDRRDVQDLIEEIFDLVQLGLPAAR